MKHLALILFSVSVSCAGGPPVTPIPNKRLLWCQDVHYTLGRQVQHVQVCHETEALCNRGVGLARRYQNIAGLHSFSTCQKLPE